MKTELKMKISPKTILISELINGFEDNEEEGVVGFGGKLNIRPQYQREFVYSPKQQEEVINSIFKGFPLNVMYWVKNDDETYELLDGQQRTLSICSYADGEFFVNLNGTPKAFPNLSENQAEQFLNYPLQVYICENGTEDEKLDWFEIINIAGEKLTKQELRNATFPGPWLSAVKRKFSKTNCVAYRLGQNYVPGNPIRQEILEKVLYWITNGGGDDELKKYMATHQHDSNADAEWQYFQMVISWIQMLFPKYRKEMKGLDWGLFYNRYNNNTYSATALEDNIKRLMMDDDVTSKKGIYEYVLSGDERKLNIRSFTDNMKREAYERQNGICPKCGNHFEITEMQGDHITPWSQGGKTVAENCQMLCADCNRRKSDN
jgi:hypothetical protein